MLYSRAPFCTRYEWLTARVTPIQMLISFISADISDIIIELLSTKCGGTEFWFPGTQHHGLHGLPHVQHQLFWIPAVQVGRERDNHLIVSSPLYPLLLLHSLFPPLLHFDAQFTSTALPVSSLSPSCSPYCFSLPSTLSPFLCLPLRNNTWMCTQEGSTQFSSMLFLHCRESVNCIVVADVMLVVHWPCVGTAIYTGISIWLYTGIAIWLYTGIAIWLYTGMATCILLYTGMAMYWYDDRLVWLCTGITMYWHGY